MAFTEERKAPVVPPSREQLAIKTVAHVLRLAPEEVVPETKLGTQEATIIRLVSIATRRIIKREPEMTVGQLLEQLKK